MKAMIIVCLAAILAISCSLLPEGPPLAEPIAWTATPTYTPTYVATSTLMPTPTNTHTATPTDAATPTGTTLPAGPPTQPARTEAMVTRIIDGDTIEVDIAGRIYTVRYIGINTPETDQAGGSEATEVNRQLVEGQVVQLDKDVSETDRYDRLLRYVYAGDLFVNAELVRRGYAQAATYPPDVAHADLFVQLEREAREAGRGLWVESVPQETVPPTAEWDCNGNLYNCGDFSSCEEVMSYWHACPGDPSQLDNDHDGRPCETLCG